MRRVRRVHTTQTVPWCTCKIRSQDGYTAHPEVPGLWVHPTCLKPTRTYWEARLAPGKA